MTTEESIEKSVVMGLARVFTEYGWDMDKVPTSFDNKIKFIKEGFVAGDGKLYQERLKKILKNARKSKNFDVYSVDYLEGLESLTDKFIKINNLDKDPEKFKFTWKLEPKVKGNIFKEDPNAHQALSRLRRFGKTNINYLYMERYGLKKLNQDLHEAGYPNATVYTNMKEHVPCEIFDGYSIQKKNTLVKVYVYSPIMPFLLVSYVQ